MKLRLATKILRRAINTGVDPRPDTLRRAVATFPKGPRHHPRKYQSAGLIAAFLELGHTIHSIRVNLDADRIAKEIESNA